MALYVIKKPINTQTQLDDLLTVCEGVGHRLHQLRSLQRKTSGIEPGRELQELSGTRVLNLKHLIVSFRNKSWNEGKVKHLHLLSDRNLC